MHAVSLDPEVGARGRTVTIDFIGAGAIEIPLPLSDLIARYAHSAAEIPVVEFAAVTAIKGETWARDSLNAELTVGDAGEAKLSFEGRLNVLQDESGGSVQLELADGSALKAEYVRSWHSGTSWKKGESVVHGSRLELAEWQWSSGKPAVAWVAPLLGAKPGASNLYVEGYGQRMLRSLRLDGNYAWHLLRSDSFGKNACLALVAGPDLTRDRLEDDFTALEFLFGGPLRLNTLIGIDAENTPVAAMGVSLGYRFGRAQADAPPVPEDRDAAWIAVAFPLVARALAAAEPNPVGIAACGYVDSTVGHIDGQYLFAQVALEAVAYRLMPKPKPVVKDLQAWDTWARSLRSHLREHAADEAAVNILAVKLKEAARPTTSRVVEKKLQEMGIVPPTEGIGEVGGRNIVAHTLSMNDGAPYDVERDVRRIRIIRALLAAMILRHVGYEGALSDWELNGFGKTKQATWFPVSAGAAAKAEQMYAARAAKRAS